VGWLTLGAGIAGGADILIQIPQREQVARRLRRRSQDRLKFSIIAIAEGCSPEATRIGFVARRRRRARGQATPVAARSENSTTRGPPLRLSRSWSG
jgi:6-phosphofructokinase 1